MGRCPSFVRLAMPLLVAFAASFLSTPARAQYGSADYSIERWDEDYSYLKNPKARDDFFDPIKYIPLNDPGDVFLSLGGQVRDRYDYFNNTNFGADVQDENGFNLARLLFHADLHVGQNFRAFVEVNSGIVSDRAGGARYGDADDFDLQQAFFDLTLPIGEGKALLARVGRQELIYGAQRFISPNDWVNVRRTFDGATLRLTMPGDTLDAFVTRPVVIDQQQFNGDDDDTWFSGIYNVTALPQLLPSADTKLDLYFLALNQRQSDLHPVGTDTYTAGVRLHSHPAPWDFDVEADWQFGQVDDASLSAWALAVEAGYTFADAAFKPRAWIGLDMASGSAEGDHRFNQLFPPQYLYLGHMYVLGRQNLIDLHPGITLNLSDAVTLSVEQHFFWRQNTDDAAYNLNGAVVRADNGSDAAEIGSEFDIVINWQIGRHVSAYLGYAHFFTGAFIDETGPSRDIDFVYAAVTFTF